MRKTPNFSSVNTYRHDLSGSRPFAGSISTLTSRNAPQYNMHYGFELGIVLSGQMAIHFPGYNMKLSAGNVWFCGIWELHGWSSGANRCEQVNLIVWPPALAALQYAETTSFNWLAPFMVSPERRPQTEGESGRAMIDLGLKIKKRIQDEKKSWGWMRLHIMEAILLATDRWAEKDRAINRNVGSSGQLNMVLSRFFERREKMTTSEAAGICGMNRDAFSRMFYDLMGLSFADFDLRYRLDAAASALRQTDEPIKSIAFRWNFSDASHFDRLFTRHYGCTPFEYRRKARPA